ncbi:DeoR family transcriptional regulator [Amaricoccus sp.]|uniref:DeoR family transcriptional regulator n=1 Tax=Amaricoccus sp. TaxID=1872485 RepID=UPI001B4288F0|nr:DeoR family transcriptional regulator [Amaricoccus sp.]MBP7003439.1 DeoR family transcriptional regulator [Amaricoccus sp.]
MPKTGKKFPGGNDRDGGGTTYAGIVADALVADLGGTHRAAKTLMNWTGAGERTVKHWLAGTHGPCGDHLLVLMRESETVFWAILAAAGRADMAATAHIQAVPRVTSGTGLLGQLAQAVGPAGEKTPGGAGRDDRDDDRDRLGLEAHCGAAPDQRRTWFLEVVGAGCQVGAVEIMERWRVSEKTARRDIAALKAKGLMEFVGTRRSGRYRPVREGGP